MRISVLVLDRVFDSGLSVVVDTLSVANGIATKMQQRAPFEIKLIGVRRRVRTANGLVAQVEPATDVRARDWVIVPALNALLPDLLVEALARPDVRDAVAHLRDWTRNGTGVAAACGGTFLLAESGALDGREATTTWSLAPLFRQRYPDVTLDDTRMLVTSDGLVTAGAAMAHVDLALWFVRQHSPELATMVARFLLVDQRTSQARYIVPHHLATADPLVERFERWVRANLSHGFSLQAAARALSVGPRTLQRRTEAVLGRSPLAFVQDLRVERAQHLVATGHDLEAIAADVGYSDASTLRTLLRRRLGRGVRELRADHA